jgi:hypothetical protein
VSGGEAGERLEAAARLYDEAAEEHRLRSQP